MISKTQEEDFQNVIGTDRRKQLLEGKVKDVSVDLKREVKAREGMCAVASVCYRKYLKRFEISNNLSHGRPEPFGGPGQKVMKQGNVMLSYSILLPPPPRPLQSLGPGQIAPVAPSPLGGPYL